MKRCYINLDQPLRAGEVRHGLLSRGAGALVFDETEDGKWQLTRRRSYQLRKFPHGTLRRMENGELRIRLTVRPTETTLDQIAFGGELGDIAEYICRYMERRRG